MLLNVFSLLEQVGNVVLLNQCFHLVSDNKIAVVV